MSARQLAAVNGISRRHPLQRGMLLTVPASMHAPAPQVIDQATDPRASTAYVPSRHIGLPAKLNGNSAGADRVNHIVRPGESLWSIAQQYGVDAGQIQQWNHLEGTSLHAGQRLRVHTPEDAAMATAAADSAQIAALHVPLHRGRHGRHGRHAGGVADGAATHTVRSGETLGAIAHRHGVSVEALRRANSLRGNNIRAGQRLRLPA